ncbi:MAG: MBL fold metallo-hydrolase [Candidatus Bathyarchaeia archaeon]
MVQLTFYGGVGEIGGNKVLLEDEDTRVFLDFGRSFSWGEGYFYDYLQPRGVNGVGDYLEFNLLPRLRGLYAKQLLRNTPLRYAEPRFDAVFISHAHVDHVGLCHFLDERIPLYCGEATKVILDALKESGGYNYGEHECRTFRTGDKLRVGTVTIEPIHVDHSIPAAYGFIIETSSGAIVYTGDLRLHGPMSRMTMELMEKAKDHEPVAMICEGTRVNPNDARVDYSEADVKRLSNHVVASTSRLVISSFYGRDIDRFNTFYHVAKGNDRKFVLSMKAAYFLSRLHGDPKLKVPDVARDENVLVYKKRKRTGQYQESDYYAWERLFLEDAVSFDYIHKNQSKILLNLDLPAFTELIDIKPTPGGHFIHSMSEPFSEEDINAEVMHNWLEHFSLRFHQIHASGHCPSGDLATIVNTILPEKLYPIHTEEPRRFRKISDKSVQVILPQPERIYRL